MNNIEASIHGFLYCLYIQGKTEETALSELKKATGYDEGVDFQMVSDFYERCRNGEYAFGGIGNQSQPNPKTSRLVSLPGHLKRDLIAKLDPPGRFMFRKVCHYFRNFVDETQFKIDKFSILIQREQIEISIQNHEEFKMIYIRTRNGCVLNKGTNAVIREGNYLEIIEKDLKEMLSSPRIIIKKLVIKEAEIHQLGTIDHRNALEMINRILIGLTHEIKVQKLCMNIARLHDIQYFLPHFDWKHLDEIIIGDEELDLILENFDQFNVYDQWKNSRKFRSRLRIECRDFVATFSHFDFVEVRLANEDFEYEDVLRLKDAFLSRPSFNQMTIDLWTYDKTYLRNMLNRNPAAQFEGNSTFSFRYQMSTDKLIVKLRDDVIIFEGPKYEKANEDDYEMVEENNEEGNERNGRAEGEEEDVEMMVFQEEEEEDPMLPDEQLAIEAGL